MDSVITPGLTKEHLLIGRLAPSTDVELLSAHRTALMLIEHPLLPLSLRTNQPPRP